MGLLKSFCTVTKLLFLGLLLIGCSSDDDLAERENYFSADVEGERLLVDEFSGLMKGEKRISVLGTVDLHVKVESEKGEAIEFVIRNFEGKRSYNIGKGFYNDSWITYSQKDPAGIWNVNKASGNLYNNRINITEDTGTEVSGQISFQGLDAISGTRKTITQGDFILRY